MDLTGNKLIDSLSAPAREQLLAACSFRELPVGTPLYQAEENVRSMYFITSGLASVVVPMIEGEMAELILIGREGMTGGIQLLGPANVSVRCFIQLAATAYRIRSATMEELFQSSDEIRTRVLEFVQNGALTVSQIAGCNSLHLAEQRLARWLMMAQDRSQGSELDFTQEFLAEMLGLQRTTVTKVAGALHEAGLIRYSRGRITILDRAGLEAESCSCYPVLHRLLQELYSRPYSAG